MGNDFVAARAEAGDEIGAVPIALGIEQDRQRNPVRIEEVRTPETSDPVAVFPPAPIVAVWMAQAGGIGQPQA